MTHGEQRIMNGQRKIAAEEKLKKKQQRMYFQYIYGSRN